jgi:hypothetical protein
MTKVIDLPKQDELYSYSNPIIAQKKAFDYLGQDAILYKSQNKDKKYAIVDPNGKIVNFGAMFYQDFLKTADQNKRDRYLKRSSKIKGDWNNNKYSPNNLSRSLLWNG